MNIKNDTIELTTATTNRTCMYSTRILKRIGTNQEVATSQLVGTHIYVTLACMLVAGFALQSEDWGSSLSGPTQSSILPSFQGRYMSKGGTLGLPGRTPGPY